MSANNTNKKFWTSFGLNSYKYIQIGKYIETKKPIILDCGAGNNQAVRAKSFFPNAKYYGIDIVENYNNTENNKKFIDKLYIMDLAKLDYTCLPDAYFDVIIMSHIIEHLYNGDEVIKLLLKKLKPGGIIYIEYPGMKATTLPRKKGTLNFFDDKSHIRIYSLREIYNIMLSSNMQFCAGGTRRSYKIILTMPFRILYSKFKNGYVAGGVFWDLLGFSEYCIFKQI